MGSEALWVLMSRGGMMFDWREWFGAFRKTFTIFSEEPKAVSSMKLNQELTEEFRFQATKARLIEELRVQGDDILAGGLGDLVDAVEES